MTDSNVIDDAEGQSVGFAGGGFDADAVAAGQAGFETADRDADGNPKTAADGGSGSFAGCGPTGDVWDQTYSYARDASRESNAQNINPAYR